jgi:hypothetical protein
MHDWPKKNVTVPVFSSFLTHVRDRVLFFCRLLIDFPSSSEKSPLIVQILKPSRLGALDCPCSLQQFSNKLGRSNMERIFPQWVIMSLAGMALQILVQRATFSFP